MIYSCWNQYHHWSCIVSLRKRVRPVRKLLHILFILHIGFTTVTVVTRPDACFCGEACKNYLYDQLATGGDISYDHRCYGYGCKTCNVERVMNFDPHNLQTAGYGRNFCESGEMSIISNDCLFTTHTIDHVVTYYHIPNLSSAIYLQTHSLLL